MEYIDDRELHLRGLTSSGFSAFRRLQQGSSTRPSTEVAATTTDEPPASSEEQSSREPPVRVGDHRELLSDLVGRSVTRLSSVSHSESVSESVSASVSESVSQSEPSVGGSETLRQQAERLVDLFVEFFQIPRSEVPPLLEDDDEQDR